MLRGMHAEPFKIADSGVVFLVPNRRLGGRGPTSVASQAYPRKRHGPRIHQQVSARYFENLRQFPDPHIANTYTTSSVSTTQHILDTSVKADQPLKAIA